MAKITRCVLIFLLTVAAVVCTALCVACAPKEATDGSVKVNGSIVFADDDHDEFTRDITLSFTPEDGSVDGVSATVTYVDTTGRTVTASGFTIAESEGKYSLRADNETYYNLDLKWNSDDSSENSVTLHGEFIVTGVINDYEEHQEGKRHYANIGHFGAASVRT